MEIVDCEDFLEVIYGEGEGWIDIPAKVGRYWVPFHAEWPADGGVSRRIDSSLRDHEDLYYSVAKFAKRGRRIEDVLPSHWLWADLDEVHPTDAAKLGFLPTIAVESSPGRYQALWRLDRTLRPSQLEKLNRALSYALDADKGGWDLTQVLRIPGTRNFKYPEAPFVRLMWYKEDLVYNAARMWDRLKAALPEGELRSAVSVVIPRRGISARAKALLRTPTENVVDGERSARLWELECLLAESGLGADEIFDLVWPCAWNKHRAVRTGRISLDREIRKAIKHVSRQRVLRETEPAQAPARPEPVEEDVDTSDLEGEEFHLPIVGYSSFMSMRMGEPKWLVRDVWTENSHGIIGGEPKTAKTTLALALGLSVASGMPFLGKYDVSGPGPVLFVQEENAPAMMQDRLRKLAWFYGLISDREAEVREARRGDLARQGSVVVNLDFPADVPLRFLNNFGFDLTDEEHRLALWEVCAEHRPRMVILDPMYLILGDVDSDKVVHVRPYLRWLLQLRYEFNCAVVLVHHMRKAPRERGARTVRAGQNLMGSAILHGWVDSALYMRDAAKDREGWKDIVVEREFRSMAPQSALEIGIRFGEPGALKMEAEVTPHDFIGMVVKRLEAEGKIALRPFAEELGMDHRQLLSRVTGDELGRVEVIPGGGRGNPTQLVLSRNGN